ncbi:Ldh family oxidoreductase [Jiangella rhizosphaerae]|uniref:Ldh family oxidoreductase n=1 Tax=Jiangella rhizosphaerae TaxID=2293569 RepID=A0A418KU00_9ACTN|nr:Ldh family oxidoreductase [Jiangella rhizosphaerae]RIQ31159.1 Ldh family oxidoreductase [Jiangella rhizosphaerae]
MTQADPIPLDVLRAHCAAVLAAAGLPAATADLVAGSLVDAEARGIGSHGVVRLRVYASRLRSGAVDPLAVPVVERDGAVARVDARNAVGQLGALTGMETAVALARDTGVGVAGVRNSNHCGTLAYLTRRGAAEGFAVVALSNAPPTMTYHGGRSRAVGTNPLSIAVPRDGGPPLVLDIATSATARGKVIVAERQGRPIPAGWAVDPDGRPTTDAAAALAGSMLPFAGPKGSGLAMMIELLCGGLVAGVTGHALGDMYLHPHRPQQVSHLFLALDPDRWLGRAAFAAHVEGFAREVHELPPADGVDRVLLPGELEDAALAAAERDGVRLSAAALAELDAVATEFGLPHRLSDLTPQME